MSELKHTVRRGLARIKRTKAHAKATIDRPKLVVSRSNRFIYAQVIDVTGKVLAAASSMKMKVRAMKAAEAVGEEVATKAKEHNVTQVAFDRHGKKYHGNVKALADSARKHGLNF